MKKIQYVGQADFRGISGEDFERIGESHDGVEFAHGQIIEVNNELGTLLLESMHFHGEFVELTDQDIKAEAKAAKEKADAELAAKVEGGNNTPPAGTVGSSGNGSTGKGSSTAGSAV